MRPFMSRPTASLPSNLDVMVARQPIYNRRMGVFGYELLFRSPDMPSSIQTEHQATRASAQVLTNAILTFDLNDLVCKRNAVINVTREIIQTIGDLPLPATQIILDLPDNITIDDDLIVKLKALQKTGYRISAGGLEKLKYLQPVLEFADIFRIDVHHIKDDQLDKVIRFLRNFRQLSLLAANIETIEEHRLYCDRGFDYLQGYFLSAPREYVSRDLPANKVAILTLLATVHSVDAEVDDIEMIFTQDVSLSYKLLKLINSPFFGVSQTVNSVRQAIVILGRSEIRRWISLLALSNIDDEPVAKIEIALLRARLCEMLAVRAGLPSDSYFTVGMFSALDLLMQINIDNILVKLPLGDEIKSAILDHQGIQGEALSCTLAIEKADWKNFKFQRLTHREIVDTFRDAVQWTNQVINSF